MGRVHYGCKCWPPLATVIILGQKNKAYTYMSTRGFLHHVFNLSYQCVQKQETPIIFWLIIHVEYRRAQAHLKVMAQNKTQNERNCYYGCKVLLLLLSYWPKLKRRLTNKCNVWCLPVSAPISWNDTHTIYTLGLYYVHLSTELQNRSQCLYSNKK